MLRIINWCYLITTSNKCMSVSVVWGRSIDLSRSLERWKWKVENFKDSLFYFKFIKKKCDHDFCGRAYLLDLTMNLSVLCLEFILTSSSHSNHASIFFLNTNSNFNYSTYGKIQHSSFNSLFFNTGTWTKANNFLGYYIPDYFRPV